MKASAVIVQVPGPLRFLQAVVVQTVSWFLFRYIQPVSAEHSQRWRQMWHRVRNGGTLTLYNAVDRDGAFHAMHMAVEGRIFEHQDLFEPDAAGERAFRLWLKTGAVFGNYEATAAGLVFVPSSCNWEDCSDDEMREFHRAALAFLRRPETLAALWPSMRAEHRLENLEALLVKPSGDDDGQ